MQTVGPDGKCLDLWHKGMSGPAELIRVQCNECGSFGDQARGRLFPGDLEQKARPHSVHSHFVCHRCQPRFREFFFGSAPRSAALRKAQNLSL